MIIIIINSNKEMLTGVGLKQGINPPNLMLLKLIRAKFYHRKKITNSTLTFRALANVNE